MEEGLEVGRKPVTQGMFVVGDLIAEGFGPQGSGVFGV
jgi:hypothetical protein